MFVSINVDEFIESYKKNNPQENTKDLRTALMDAVKNKKSGCKCSICENPIWAIGTSIVGWNGCFTCISGEADNSEDYEIDEVISI